MKVLVSKPVNIKFDNPRFKAEENLCRASQKEAHKRLKVSILTKACGVCVDALHAVPGLFPLARGEMDMSRFLAQILALERVTNRPLTRHQWLQLLAVLRPILERGPPTNEILESAREERKHDLNLIEWWVAPPDHPALLQASLCFYAWPAMVEVVHLRGWKNPGLSDGECIEQETLKKHCFRLGLRHSRFRPFKKVTPNYVSKLLQYEVFKGHLDLDR
jgi:hypothetical protein